MAESVRFQHFEVPRREDGSLYELGRGAMGITYKAFDTNLRCFVALKVINATYLENDVARQRFLREARAAAALRHPNVATVFHLGQEGDDCFYAMEYIDGETVEALMKREGAIPADMALKITLQVARALGAAQKQNLIHRDIKPSNLMIVREDDSEFTVKVIDFGLAKSAGGTSGEDSAALTMGGFLGTPHFASPEQLEERDLDVRSDIYSLGVTLYYMLAGRAPFSGSLAQVMSQHLHRDPPLDAISDQPAPILDLLRNMLAKDPAARPQTPAELRRQIEACLELSLHAPSAKTKTIVDEDFETQALDAGTSTELELVPGTVLANRYRLVSEITTGKQGRIFRAETLDKSAALAILILDPSQLKTSETYTRIEEQIAILKKFQAPALQKILSLERIPHLSFVVMEWIEGPSLLDLMRTRRALPVAEVLPILRSLAAGFEALQEASLPCPDISAHEITLTGGNVDRPVSDWGSFIAKFNALSISAPSTNTPETTLITSAFFVLQKSGAFATNKAGASIYTLATLAYKMLGGVSNSATPGIPVPIPGLSESGNAILRRALDPTQSFQSISDFLNQLQGSGGANRTSSTPSGNQSPKSSTAPAISSGKSRKLPLMVITPIVIIFLAASGFLVMQNFRRPSAPSVPTPSPTPLTRETPSPTSTPDPLAAELAKARENLTSDPAASLEALLEILKTNRDNPLALNALKSTLRELRGRSETLTLGQVAALAKPLEAAAQLDLSDAEIMLGEEIRESDAAAALNLFLAATDNNDNTESMLLAGLMLSNGKGVSKPDAAGALDWFKKAADLGDPLAMYYLAECYLSDSGQQRNPHLAIKMLRAAVDKGEPRAMNLLGDKYCKGIPDILEQNFSQAFSLFSSAAKIGWLDAQGNLGVLYMNGQGTEEDPQRAIELFRDGAKKNNPLCMQFYARSLEAGLGGTIASKDEARIWYMKAAALGNLTAQNWCRENKVPFTAKSPTP